MELTLDQALQKGVEAHKAGKVQEADRYYTAILKANPKHPDANHNMGVLAVGVGKLQEALPFFKTALEANSSIAQYWLSYIDALIKLDRMDDAKAVLDQAKSNGADGDRFDEMEKQLGGIGKETEIDPTLNMQEPPGDQFQSTASFYSQGQYQEALNEAIKLLEQFPNSINLYNIMGAANQGLGKLDEAIEAYNKAITLKPDYADSYYNMGNALKDQGKLDEAVQAFTKAIALKPDYTEAYNNMGIVFDEQGRLEDAVEAYNKTLSIKPDYADAHNNIGNALKEQGKLDEAIEAYTKALSIKPASETLVNALDLRNQLADTVFITEDFKKTLAVHRVKLMKNPKLPIHQAIGAFLLSDQKLVRKHLGSYASFTPSSIAKLKSKDQVFCSAYNIFLQKLIEEPLAIETTIANDQTVFHIGESHCLSYAHRLIKIHGINYIIKPRITFGGKAYHFSTEQENAFKAITKSNFASLPDSSKAFLSFGEIDCRPNEGFISAAKKHKKLIEDLVSDTVRGYVDWFVEQNQNKNHSLFFFNVPAPRYNEKYSLEVNGEVKRTIKVFNSILNKTVLDHEFNIIDVNKFTVGKDGYSNGLFHIDRFHLSSDAIPEIEKQIGTFL